MNPGFRRISYTTPSARWKPDVTEGFAIELEGSVAVNCIRLELGVWTEGYAFTLDRAMATSTGPRHRVVTTT